MKFIFYLVLISFSVIFYNSVNAETIKWLHIQGDSSPEFPNYLRAAEDFEAKTGHTVELQYLENEAFKAKLPTMLQSDDRPHIIQSWGGGVMLAQYEAGLLRDITDLVPQSYLDNVSAAASDAFVVKGTRIGFPRNVSQVTWWYNLSLIHI